MPPMNAGGGGFKRSRALWDKALLPSPSSSSLQYVSNYLQAVLYELQPIRYSELKWQWHQFQLHVRVGILSLNPQQRRQELVQCFQAVQTFLLQQLLPSIRWKHVLWMTGIVLYYSTVRWIHVTLELGPAVLMVTALVTIFTIGLSDRKPGDDDDGLSAYSVFNRGFQRLLGSVNEDDLVAQHVGGGMGMGGGVAAGWRNQNPPPEDDNNNDRNRNRNAQQQRRQGGLRRRRNNNNNNNPNHHDAAAAPDPPPRAAAAAAAPEEEAAAAGRRGGGRLSGKKARRGNLEQREELRQQRQAARELGFQQPGNEQDAAAVQQLLLDQIQEQQQQQQQQEENNENALWDEPE